VDDASRRWCLVLPVKRLTVAKTRLGPPYDGARQALALAFALDTTAAALACPLVAAVQVVTDDPEAARALSAAGADVSADGPDAGLNPALVHGAALAARRHPGTSVGTVAADLPALRPAELAVALRSATGHGRSFVRDAQGTGTTLLLARAAEDLRPMFGPGSAARHAGSGGHEVAADNLPSLRRDVDTAADLQAAVLLGVGPWTTRVLDAAGTRRPQAG
jgi:2-phospho-L-lactate guanylyltransferase